MVVNLAICTLETERSVADICSDTPYNGFITNVLMCWL